MSHIRFFNLIRIMNEYLTKLLTTNVQATSCKVAYNSSNSCINIMSVVFKIWNLHQHSWDLFFEPSFGGKFEELKRKMLKCKKTILCSWGKPIEFVVILVKTYWWTCKKDIQKVTAGNWMSAVVPYQEEPEVMCERHTGNDVQYRISGNKILPILVNVLLCVEFGNAKNVNAL